jgi:hypothetical protein
MELFVDVVGQRAELAPLYERAAAAIHRRDADAAAEAVGKLTAAQETAMLGG